ncbi:MAG: alkaline phosphatase D family protein [Sphingomonas oligoaromativorans]
MTLLTPSRRAVIGGLVAAPFVLPAGLRAQTLGFVDYPFTLGVASGDALPDGFVIWTRLAPKPLEPQGGMPIRPVAVDWEVAEDDGFRTVVSRGSEVAHPELAHSVHVEVSGLKPGRPYWYRFKCAGEKSLTGMARTLPAIGATVDKVRFAAVGCQHFEAGWYTAYRHVAEEELDFVFHYGDYIYEYHPGTVTNERHQPIDPVRLYVGGEPYTLGDYRIRYAQETLDTDLMAARAAHPWFCTYDDHEVDNNWVSDRDQDGTDPALFLLRRRQALQAWYEHMPVRRASFPQADGAVEFRRRADYGDLLRGHFLNTRLYRTDQPCGDDYKPACAGVSAADAQILGAQQEHWLGEGLASSHQRWQLIAQQVMICPLDRREHDEPQPVYNMDSWAGYQGPRTRLFDQFAAHKGGNIVVVTGDEHQNFANDLIHHDKVVASEFVSTSISSGGDGHETRPGNEAWMRRNPCLKWTGDRRGYALSEVTREAWTCHFRAVDAVSVKGMPIRTASRWAVQAGKAGLVQA